MSRNPHKRKPGDLEIRIRPDGRVFMPAADEDLLDIWEALEPGNPLVIKRREAKVHAKSRGPQAR